MEKNTKTHPTARMKLQPELTDPEEEDLSFEEEDLEDVEEDEPVVPTNKPQPTNVNQGQVELQLESDIRKLAEVETQMITKKIALKNPDSLTGVYSEQEMITLAQTLKFNIQARIDYMKATFEYDDKFFIDKFKEVEKGIKSYEYWIVPDKKR